SACPVGAALVIGLPMSAIARPQCAIAHCGSRRAMSLNALSAASNQNECSIATPSAKSLATSSAQLTSNVTLPTFVGSPAGWSWTWAVRETGADTASSRVVACTSRSRISDMRPPGSRDDGRGRQDSPGQQNTITQPPVATQCPRFFCRQQIGPLLYRESVLPPGARGQYASPM